MKLWILLPAFNEAVSLTPLLEAIDRTLNRRVPYEVLVVDDGSQDETHGVAESLGRRLPVAVVSHGTNRGLARGIETGIRWILARARDEDVVVTMDADNTHPAGLLLNMLEEARAGADLVIASRYAPGGKEEGVPLRRRILSRGIGVLLRVRFGLREVRDYSSGYRLYRARLLRAAAERYGSRLIEAQGFAVMTDLLVKLQALSPRVVEVPLHLRYDLKRGSSKLRLRQTIADYLALLVRRP